MAIAAGAIAADHTEKGKKAMSRLDAYLHAHWRELLAIVLMAIPAAFLLFHKGTQQAASTLLTLPGVGAPGGAATDTTTPTPAAAVAGVAAAPAAAAAAVGGAVQAAVAPAAAAVKQVIAPAAGPTSTNGSTGRSGPDVGPTSASGVPNYTTSPLFRTVTPPADQVQAASPGTPARTVLKPTKVPGISKKTVIPAKPATPATPIITPFNPVKARSSGNQAV